MTIKDILFLDTETTGIPDRSANWETDFESYPHVVQIAWIYGDVQESHIIRPTGWEIPDETVAVHGITTEYALEHGEPFVVVIDRLIAFCSKAGLICGHNIHFDTGIIKANILRELGHEYYDSNDVETALYKGKRIDTMRPTMKWVDARFASGRLKFPNLGELYSRCFPGETFPAHDALEDCKAVARCLPVILENGLVELKVKEYDQPAPEDFKTIQNTGARMVQIANVPEKAGNGPTMDAKQKDDKLPIQPVKAPEIENFKKITDAADDLLDQNDF